VGVQALNMMTTTQGTTAWVMDNSTGQSAGDLYSKDGNYVRCIFPIY
jgi:hypothetical protein